MSKEPYRAPLPQIPDPYLVAWDDMRRRQRAAVVYGWLAGAWIVVIAGLELATSFLKLPIPHTWALTMPATVWLFVLQHRIRTFQCPKCGAQGWNYLERKRRECSNCHIAIGTPKSACHDDEADGIALEKARGASGARLVISEVAEEQAEQAPEAAHARQ